MFTNLKKKTQQPLKSGACPADITSQPFNASKSQTGESSVASTSDRPQQTCFFGQETARRRYPKKAEAYLILRGERLVNIGPPFLKKSWLRPSCLGCQLLLDVVCFLLLNFFVEWKICNLHNISMICTAYLETILQDNCRKGNWRYTEQPGLWSCRHRNACKVGPLPVINGIITPINGLING